MFFGIFQAFFGLSIVFIIKWCIDYILIVRVKAEFDFPVLICISLAKNQKIALATSRKASKLNLNFCFTKNDAIKKKKWLLITNILAYIDAEDA
jgi:hypothetical protein